MVGRYNKLSLDENRKIPLEKFSRVEDDICIDDFHIFRCLFFILDKENQYGGSGTPNWNLIPTRVYMWAIHHVMPNI